MTVATTTERIAAMYRLIPGVKTAYTYIPRTLQAAQLPAIVLEPGEAVYDTASVGDGMLLSIEVYRATLFYDQALFGTETQSESGLLPLIDSIKDYFFRRPGLQLDTLADPESDVVFNATLVRSGGYQIKSYPTGKDVLTDFATVMFFHQVQEMSQIVQQY